MYSILTTVFLYLSYFVCLQLLLKFIQKKKKKKKRAQKFYWRMYSSEDIF